MAIGDAAAAAGLPLVDGDSLLIQGDEEINRTRDMVANVMGTVPVGKAAFRTAAGISSGTTDPTGGDNGDIYFKILS